MLRGFLNKSLVEKVNKIRINGGLNFHMVDMSLKL